MLRLTLKNLKISKILWTSSMGLYKWIWALFFWTFIHGLGLRPNSLLDQAKISIWVQTIAPHIHCGQWVILYVLKPHKNILLVLFPIMKLKIHLSSHDVEFQRQERAKLDRIKKQLLILKKKFLPSSSLNLKLLFLHQRILFFQRKTIRLVLQAT